MIGVFIIDFKSIEKKWQKKWQEAKIFEAYPDKRKKYFITVPYPYVSGPYHIGHGRAYSGGDIFARFTRLNGFNVLFPMAFHITGTPVLAVSKAIESKDAKSMDMYREYIAYHTKEKSKIEKILKSFAEPMNVYKYFSKTMRMDFESLGMSIDWRRDFTTGDEVYNKFIEWQFKKFKEKKYLIRGKYPITFCLNCDNAVGEDDIKEGDTNPVSVNEFTFLKFKFDDCYLVAATLRPETVFGQTNLWIDPETGYLKVKVGKENWIVSKECAEKLKYQKDNIERISNITGSELIGKYCTAPGIDRKIMILPSFFCDADIGSGIVTSVPSDAPYDFVALRDLQANKELCEKYCLNWDKIKAIEIIPIIETKKLGDRAAERIVEEMSIKSQKEKEKLEEATQIVYKAGFHEGVMNKNCGKYAGMPVEKAKEEVKRELLSQGKADIFFETSRKAACKCGGKIIVANLKDQWFLDYNATGWKYLANKCLKKIIICPEKYRTVFEDTFAWLDKRPCARKRGLGTKLPFDKNWIIESLSDSTIYMAFYTIAHIIKDNKIKPVQLISEVFDYVFLSKGKVGAVAKKSKISEKILKKMKTEFEYWYPVDQRHTAIMHISNHLSFFLFHHSAIFPEKHWPKAITLIEPVIVEGTKMGKSKGNVIPLVEVSRKYCADLFRLYMAHTAELGAKVDWKESEVEATRRQLERFYNLVSLNIPKNLNTPVNLSLHSKALLSKFTRKVNESKSYIEKFDLRKYSQSAFFDIMNHISEYISLADKREQRQILPSVFEKWLIALSPLIPHLCEELWSKLGKKNFISLSKWPEYDPSKIDLKLEAAEDLVKRTMKDIEDIKTLSKIEKPRKITIFVSPSWKHEVYNLVLENKELKEIMAEEKFKKIGKTVAVYYQRLQKKKPLEELFLTETAERGALEDAKSILEKQFGCKVLIIPSEKSDNLKAKSAEPGKPGILLEF